MKVDIFKARNKIKAFKTANDIRKGDFKQVIVVNKSLNMSKGKLAAQVAHASTLAMLEGVEAVVCGWLDNSYPKVVLKVDTTQDLLDLQEKANDLNIATALVIDEGRTELSNGAITCLGIGPDVQSRIDEVTGELKLL